MHLFKACLIGASTLALLTACGSSHTVERETVTPVATPVVTEPTAVPAPPPGGKTTIKTEDADGNEHKVEIKDKSY
jgi:hypothetical protein